MRMLDAAEDDHDLILKTGQKSLKAAERSVYKFPDASPVFSFSRDTRRSSFKYHRLLALQLPLQHDILVRVLICY